MSISVWYASAVEAQSSLQHAAVTSRPTNRARVGGYSCPLPYEVTSFSSTHSWLGLSIQSPITTKCAIDPVEYSTTRHPWGKFKSPECYHCLEHHCADVAACFQVLLADPVVRARIERAAGQSRIDQATGARLAVLAFLHDFGKLNSGFQFKVYDRAQLPPGGPPRAGHVEQALLCCQQEDMCEAIGLHAMYDTWGDGFLPLLRASLAHHGRPAKRSHRSGTGPAALWKPYAGYDPLGAAKLFGERIRLWFPDAFADGPPLPDTTALAHLFAGAVALADQIGSDEAQFKFVPEPDPNYIERAHRQAKNAIQAHLLRRRDWAPRSPAITFADLFDHPVPRPLQTAVADAPLTWPLLLLESETGSGKTEAAVLRFNALWRAGLVDGLYFAVPTRAAAKQLQRRVDAAARRLFPPDTRAETVLAIPGYLQAGVATARRVGRFQVEWEDDPEDELTRRARWSAESSRHFLSSVAAVGTVDQVLLAALKVKWAHLRGSALSRSLLVVDEAHASDAYMTELLRALLRDHLAVGGHALLMSATLGSAARVGLTDHRPRPGSPPLAAMEAVPYPALTLVGHGVAETRGLSETGHTKAIKIWTEPSLGDADRIADLALAAGREGAKVLVIRNTVTEAQAVFRAVEDQGGSALTLQAADGPALHHSRFAAEDRHLLDDAVEKALGKGRAVGGVVVIGTQTLEQSLDIDADLLISDICPVDVLLQRIGRLHRHREAQRAAAFAAPRCMVLVPEEGLAAGLGGGLLRYGLGAASDGGGIYRDLLGLEATHRLIAQHPVWKIPAMNRMLVEQATHEDALCRLATQLGGPWMEQQLQTWGFAAAERGVARGHLLDRNTTFDERLVFPDLDEKVRTRLGEDGPRIELAEPQPGPFGLAVRTFNLPAHFFERQGGGLPTKEEIAAASADRTATGLILHVADHVFEYDRLGVQDWR